jgi:hypothetical protein
LSPTSKFFDITGNWSGKRGPGMEWEERLLVWKMKWREDQDGSAGFKTTGDRRVEKFSSPCEENAWSTSLLGQ